MGKYELTPIKVPGYLGGNVPDWLSEQLYKNGFFLPLMPTEFSVSLETLKAEARGSLSLVRRQLLADLVSGRLVREDPVRISMERVCGFDVERELPDCPLLALRPRHPRYRWTGPTPWAPEEY